MNPPKPTAYVSTNEIPDAPDFDGQELWVRLGDGWYRRLWGQQGKWIEDLTDAGNHYDQSES